MKEILSKLGIDIAELARRFDVSRPTVYNYIKKYGSITFRVESGRGAGS